MNTELSTTPDFSRQVTAHQEALHAGLCQALRETVFYNSKHLAPRHLDEIGRGETTAFLRFLETGDETAVRVRGRQLALEGLGHRAILAMTEALRRTFREGVHPDGEAAGRHVCALLEGYMAGREENLLREQERTREAFLRASERQAGQ